AVSWTTTTINVRAVAPSCHVWASPCACPAVANGALAGAIDCARDQTFESALRHRTALIDRFRAHTYVSMRLWALT
ncbi:unnamed protein product, partial [Mycena citricolor]